MGKYALGGDEDAECQDIEWIVLSVQNDKMLVVSKYAITMKRYHGEWEHITWENCTLREWLNNDFFNEAFSKKEKNQILETEVTNGISLDVDGGNDTKDRIFLLSIDEANEYLNPSSRECYRLNGEHVEWWLRSPGKDQYCAASMYPTHEIIRRSNDVYFRACGVRPAMWIDINAYIKN